jgi:hypothetical protein
LISSVPAQVATTLVPEALSNCGISSRNDSLSAPEASTLISAACAILDINRLQTAAAMSCTFMLDLQ